jgi:hypothetical protein
MLRVAFATVLGLVGVVVPSGRKSPGRDAIDDAIQPWANSIVDTPTPPSVSHRINLSRWEDLLHTAELLGRPILRLNGGEGGAEGRIFYVADGPQSYVFGFGGLPVNVTKSGAYAPPAPPVPIPSPLPSPEEAPAELDLPEPAPVAPSRPRPPARPPVVEPVPTPTPAPPAEIDPADALLGPELPERLSDADLPSGTVVERRIREMIHELLVGFRKLPASSDRLELGTEHIQRAIDMLHLGRYGIAQIELNKAARLLKEEDPGT